MPVAKGSYGRIIYVAESTWGVTPETPSCTLIQFTSESLEGRKETLQSNMLRSDRNVDYVIYGTLDAGGSISGELVYKLYDDFMESALFNTWTTNVLKNGSTRKSFSIEKGFTDISNYIVYRGMVVNTMTVRIASSSIVTVEFAFLGKDEQTPSSTSIDSTVTLPTGVGTSPMDSFSGSMLEGGSAIALVTSIEFTVSNNISNEGFVVGSTSRADLFEGRCTVNGTFSAYVPDMTIYSKFVNGTESSLSVTVQDAAAKYYTFDFPRVKYGGSTPKISGEGPIVMDIPFTALYSSTDGCTVKITRSA